ncbi:energy transducer TonB, partial [Tepidimonas ignava]
APPQPEATPTPAPEAVAVTSAPPVAAPATPAPGAAVAASAVEAASPAASAAAAPAAAPRIELPSASAAYLNNPPPPYPALSRRLGEQGRVVLRVRIEPDGTASAAEIRTSSGYERLDQAALQAVLRWRYVPGKRNGVPEAMWFLVPVQFVLQ